VFDFLTTDLNLVHDIIYLRLGTGKFNENDD
jgi:hypothetical protein